MAEHLAAVLSREGLRGATEVPVAVLDPFTLQWSRVVAQVAPFEDVFLAGYAIKRGEGYSRGMMLVGKAGDVLFSAALSGDGEIIRTPAEDSAAGKRVAALLAALQARADGK